MRIAYCLKTLLIIAVASIFSTVFSATGSQIREDIYSAKSVDQFESAYFNSTDDAAKISALQALPMATNRFAINIKASSAPTTISRILNDALASNEIDLVLCAINQIGEMGISSYESILIKMYNDLNGKKADIKNQRISLAIIDALGSFSTPGSISLLGQIIDTHQINLESYAALLSIGKAHATELVPNIKALVSDIETKIQKKEIATDKKAAMQPDFILTRAQSTILTLGTK